MTFSDWFTLVWRTAEFLNHQWALAFSGADDAPWPTEAPQSHSEVEKLLNTIENWVVTNSHPGPAGWGICSPSLIWSGRGVEYHHTTARNRLRVYAWYAGAEDAGIEVVVQRPYAWQSEVARVRYDEGGLTVTYNPPVGARHFALVREVVDAWCISGEIPQPAELLDAEQLAEADVLALAKFYNVPASSILRVALQLAQEQEERAADVERRFDEYIIASPVPGPHYEP